ncbi:MAG: PilZ domain-containing protein [Acidobacteriota bacterium]
MAKQREDAAEDRNRRQHERIKVAQPVKLEATLRGRFIDIMRLEMTGVTIDLSNGGFCANVDQSISPGVRCRVEIVDDEGGDPRSLWGRVRRTTLSKGGYVVALEFDEPVEAAELLGKAGAEGAVIEIEDEG